MDEMERQTKQRWETRGTSHGLKGGDGTENRLQVPIIAAGRTHHLGAVLTTRMPATKAKTATDGTEDDANKIPRMPLKESISESFVWVMACRVGPHFMPSA